MTAEIDSRLVRRAIENIRDASQELKKLVRAMFGQLESNPSFYQPLNFVDPELTARFPRAVFRKVYLRHQRHDFRVVFIHGETKGGQERVKLLLAFDREDGWNINWDVLKDALGDEFP